MGKNSAFLWVALIVSLATPACSWAALVETSWIFRSEVAAGQSMWGPGTLTSYNFSDSYTTNAWPFDGTGFSWSLQAEQGVVSGNVEGLVRAKYDNYIHGPVTHIGLSYAGIPGESRIGTSLTTSLGATPRLRFAPLPYPFPAIDWSMPVSALNVGVSTKADYTTGLGGTTAASGSYTVLPFSLEAGIFGVALDIGLDQDIWFTPRTVAGTVTATHMASGATRTAPVLVNTDNQEIGVDLPLDIKGHWEICLENFSVDENTFRQELGLFAQLGFKVPLLGVNWAFNEDSYFDLYDTTFALDFRNHLCDGNDLTADCLGRFSVYVDPVPEPATLALLTAAMAAAVVRRRR